MANFDTLGGDAGDPQAVNTPYNGGNDELMFNRLDGPFATREKIQEAIDSDVTPRMKRASVNEPYTPLMTVNADSELDLHNPVRIEAMPPPDAPERPPEVEPPA